MIPAHSHLGLEIAAAFKRKRALDPGEPVPGCGCEWCTGVSLPPSPPPRRAGPGEDWQRLVDHARSVSILDVLHRLGIETVRRRRSVVARCPLHDDRRPSMSIDPAQGLWFCFPCAEGGDALRLLQRVRRCGFTEAVKELAA